MFSALDETEVEVVIDAMDEKRVVQGDSVILEGESGDELYVVEDGILECYKLFVKSLILNATSLERKCLSS